MPHSAPYNASNTYDEAMPHLAALYAPNTYDEAMLILSWLCRRWVRVEPHSSPSLVMPCRRLADPDLIGRLVVLYQPHK